MLKTYSMFDDILQRDQHAVAKGTILKSEGEESHSRMYVAGGWLAASKSLEDGEQQIIEFILPGETYDPTATDGKTSFLQIEALCDAVIVSIDKTSWAQLLRQDPELRKSERQREIAAQARQSERMLRLGRASAETRIAYVLIELCIRVSRQGTGFDSEFHVPFGQQQLGDFTGLSSVHVCRTLRRLNRAGVIRTGDHMDILIKDQHALAELAQVDIAALRDEITTDAA
ncbi:Crp/Fnr family transcriptional regulator [Marivita sp.]|uniref:Crp/Fnr family transcriptional regulator n=1 Tax=Marivita sp. TaxID=2003365 RepID=UPI0025C00787|nr:Crp/Fnr family transcriptional regulator [Marivita sp.]